MIKLKDVADAANVSIATASKVLGGGVESERISEAARQRILEACAELGYRPNYQARSLQSGRANAIGSLLGDTARGSHRGIFWWGLINAGMAIAALQHENQLVTIGGRGHDLGIENALQSLQEKRIDALVAPGYMTASPIFQQLVETKSVIVMASTTSADCTLPVVDVDEADGARQAVQHLHELGHRAILWLESEGDINSCVQLRRKAVQATARELKMKVAVLTVALPDEALTETIVDLVSNTLIERWTPQLQENQNATSSTRSIKEATAVIAFNESIALGVYVAASKLGLRVPDDLSVVSFDDLFAQFAYPSMTVVSLMLRKIGSRSVELALEIAGKKPEERAQWNGYREKIAPCLMVRNSTAAVCR